MNRVKKPRDRNFAWRRDSRAPPGSTGRRSFLPGCRGPVVGLTAGARVASAVTPRSTRCRLETSGYIEGYVAILIAKTASGCWPTSKCSGRTTPVRSSASIRDAGAHEYGLPHGAGGSTTAEGARRTMAAYRRFRKHRDGARGQQTHTTS